MMTHRFAALATLAVALSPLAAGLPSAHAQNAAPITPRELQVELARNPQGADAEALAARVRATVGADNLKSGNGAPRRDGYWAILALETEAGQPRAVPVGNIRSWVLQRIGQTSVWATVAALPNFAVTSYQYDVGGQKLGGATVQVEYYPPHPDGLEQTGVPKGSVTKYTWKSKIFDGTTRDYWVYVPKQYAAEKPAAVMVFQDGGGYRYATTMLDNLIHKGDMPVTVGIFINPGTFEGGRSNRSFEYDTLSDQYARFLRDEILPEVSKTVRLTDDPERRALCGASSGGICAFTVAWEMPDLFRKVVTHVGSFVNIAQGQSGRAGGHNYAAILRKTPNKPLRIWMQDGSNDLDNEHGNWPLANQELAASLRFKGYDYQFLYGQGFHSGLHGQATLPDALRWLWRDVR